jgi:hypothetical protein
MNLEELKIHETLKFDPSLIHNQDYRERQTSYLIQRGENTRVFLELKLGKSITTNYSINLDPVNSTLTVKATFSEVPGLDVNGQYFPIQEIKYDPEFDLAKWILP